MVSLTLNRCFLYCLVSLRRCYHAIVCSHECSHIYAAHASTPSLPIGGKVHFILASFSAFQEPVSYSAAMRALDVRSSYEWGKWFFTNSTWEIVDVVPACNLFSSKRVFKLKRSEHDNVTRYRGRLVAAWGNRYWGHFLAGGPILSLASHPDIVHWWHITVSTSAIWAAPRHSRKHTSICHALWSHHLAGNYRRVNAYVYIWISLCTSTACFRKHF